MPRTPVSGCFAPLSSRFLKGNNRLKPSVRVRVPWSGPLGTRSTTGRSISALRSRGLPIPLGGILSNPLLTMCGPACRRRGPQDDAGQIAAGLNDLVDGPLSARPDPVTQEVCVRAKGVARPWSRFWWMNTANRMRSMEVRSWKCPWDGCGGGPRGSGARSRWWWRTSGLPGALERGKVASQSRQTGNFSKPHIGPASLTGTRQLSGNEVTRQPNTEQPYSHRGKAHVREDRGCFDRLPK